MLLQRFIMWRVFVADVARTVEWFRLGLGIRTSGAQDRIVVVRNSSVSESDDVWVHFGSQPSMLLYPADDRRITETALAIQVPRLGVVADRLASLRWDYGSKGPATLVIRSPDGWPINLTPLPDARS